MRRHLFDACRRDDRLKDYLQRVRIMIEGSTGPCIHYQANAAAKYSVSCNSNRAAPRHFILKLDGLRLISSFAECDDKFLIASNLGSARRDTGGSWDRRSTCILVRIGRSSFRTIIVYRTWAAARIVDD